MVNLYSNNLSSIPAEVYFSVKIVAETTKIIKKRPDMAH